LYRAIEKKKQVNHDCHGSVGSASLNIAVFDNRSVSLLEVKGLKYVSLTIAIFKLALPTEPR
jgi:hypothetical protein